MIREPAASFPPPVPRLREPSLPGWTPAETLSFPFECLTGPQWSEPQRALGLPAGRGWHVLVDGAVLLGAVLGQEAVGVLVHTQVVQRWQVLAAQVAAVAQLLLVALDVLQKGVKLRERLGAAFDHALVYLEERCRAGEGRQERCLSCHPVLRHAPQHCCWAVLSLFPCSPAGAALVSF